MAAIKEAPHRSTEPPARVVDQAALVASLCRPAVFGSDVERVRVVETHISYVLLTEPTTRTDRRPRHAVRPHRVQRIDALD